MDRPARQRLVTNSRNGHHLMQHAHTHTHTPPAFFTHNSPSTLVIYYFPFTFLLAHLPCITSHPLPPRSSFAPRMVVTHTLMLAHRCDSRPILHRNRNRVPIARSLTCTAYTFRFHHTNTLKFRIHTPTRAPPLAALQLVRIDYLHLPSYAFPLLY